MCLAFPWPLRPPAPPWALAGLGPGTACQAPTAPYWCVGCRGMGVPCVLGSAGEGSGRCPGEGAAAPVPAVGSLGRERGSCGPLAARWCHVGCTPAPRGTGTPERYRVALTPPARLSAWSQPHCAPAGGRVPCAAPAPRAMPASALPAPGGASSSRALCPPALPVRARRSPSQRRLRCLAA